ncbi:MAG: rhomboid family intramembrane serine protease [Spirochaetales bacterium]|nr:rhomboid family intramembrane serine protease [Spirochaetales bacterium]
MRIKYNAPTTLTFSFFCAAIVLTTQFVFPSLTRALFTVPNALAFNLMDPLNYLRLFTHIAGHADWTHLMSNLAYILLLGPMLEETYGSFTMFLMILVTGFVTGVLNVCFFPHPLLGASGVVFMMILLASFTNHGKDDVPLTFILIVILYLGREIQQAFNGDDISQFAHLAGGLCGSLFGFFKPVRTRTAMIAQNKTVNRSTQRKTLTYGSTVPSSTGKSTAKIKITEKPVNRKPPIGTKKTKNQ